MKDFNQAKWISSGQNIPFYARKKFDVVKRVKCAEIKICGLGQFQLFINGKKVSENVLEPAWTDYSKLINYITYDVTDLLEDKNTIAAEVGNGWFIMDDAGQYVFHFPPFMPPNPNGYHPYSDVLMLIACLKVEYEDREIEYVVSDESWMVKEHMILHSNVFGSEVIDGRKRIEDWNQYNCDEISWNSAILVEPKRIPTGKLKEQHIPSPKVICIYEGKYCHSIGRKWIYDFGQNTAGMLTLEVKGKKGDVIRIFPAEKLNTDGDVDQMAKNWLPIDVCETYIIGKDDEWESFEMTFTYVGARFVAIEGTKHENLRNIKMHAISSAYERAGKFECDDERFEQIYDLVEKAVEANMLSVHTDCPTIERFAWQEENHLMAPSIMFMKKVKKHWEKFLEDARIAQHEAKDRFNDFKGGDFFPGEGLIPSMAPCYIPNVLPVPGMGSFYDIIGWGSSIILGTYWYYWFYADLQVVEKNYDAGKRYLEHLKCKVNEEGFINHGLGDWGNPNGEFARENVETALFYADYKVMGYFAKLLGRQDDASYFMQEAKKIKTNYNEKLLCRNPLTGKYTYRVWDKKDDIIQTQAALAMPLYWGLVPEEQVTDIIWSLRTLLEEDQALRSGEVGHPYIIQTMSKYGMHDLICKFILKEEHPSYYAFVKAGETTLGEYWEENPRSHCHDMMGHIVEWFYNGLAGIQPTEPGFKKVIIKPYLPESMHEMQCSFDSKHGNITVKMKRIEGSICLETYVQEGIEVEIDKSFLR